jgi:hypothetical protein
LSFSIGDTTFTNQSGGFGLIPYQEKKVTVDLIAHMMSFGSNLSGGFSLDAFNLFDQTLFEK